MSPKQSEPSRRRWIVTGLCFLMAFFAWGAVFYGQGFYITVLSERLGWSTGLLSSGVSVFYGVGVGATLLFGWLIDRWGPRWIALYGTVAIGGGLALLSVLREPWQMYVIYALMGSGYPAMATLTISSALMPWFKDRLGLALGIALSGASIGGAVIVPVLTYLLPVYGFDLIIRTLGAIIFICLAPLVLWLLQSPMQTGAEKPATLAAPAPASYGQFLAMPAFWRIAAACSFALGAQVGFLTHQLPAVAQAIGLEKAAIAVAITALSAILGRFLLGYFAARRPLHQLAAICYGTQALGLMLLPLGSAYWLIYAASALAGTVVGAIVMLPPLLLRETFGAEGYGRAYGLITMGMFSAVAVLAWITGLMRDVLGDYLVAFLALGGLNLAAAAIILLPIGKNRH